MNLRLDASARGLRPRVRSPPSRRGNRTSWDSGLSRTSYRTRGGGLRSAWPADAVRARSEGAASDRADASVRPCGRLRSASLRALFDGARKKKVASKKARQRPRPRSPSPQHREGQGLRGRGTQRAAPSLSLRPATSSLRPRSRSRPPPRHPPRWRAPPPRSDRCRRPPDPRRPRRLPQPGPGRSAVRRR